MPRDNNEPLGIPADAGIKKAEKKEYELIKRIRVAGKDVVPAEEGETTVLVNLRFDQAKRLAASGHIKLTASQRAGLGMAA